MTCLFCRIAAKEIPAAVVFEDDKIMAFRDVNPQAPTHLLIIPKHHISSINAIEVSDSALLGHMMFIAKQIAMTEDFANNGYRLVMNTNEDGGQTVFHMHLHVLAGRQLQWPPG